MKSFSLLLTLFTLLLTALLLIPLIASRSFFNTYDLGLQGLFPTQSFHSSSLSPVQPRYTKWDSRCGNSSSTEKIFLTPRGPNVNGASRGPTILDAKGELLWMDTTVYKDSMNLNVQEYHGERFLTFWTKSDKKTWKRKGKTSHKHFVMMDSTYKVRHRIFPHGGLKGDAHEFRITPTGTALITIYHRHLTSCIALAPLGIPARCWIQDGLFQEIDIATGRLLFQWRASDHIPFSEPFSTPSRKDGYGRSKKDAFDFFHINSVDKNDDGDYMISARYMHAAMCISHTTGKILWQLGGRQNSFSTFDHETKRAAAFEWQHHVTWQGNNTLTLFDNHANSVLHSPALHARGMMIQLNVENMTANILQTYIHPDRILPISQGSVQVLKEGSRNVFIGWGNSPSWVEYERETGTVLCAAHYAPKITFELVDFGWAKSYRIFKQQWVGRPQTLPDVKVKGRKVYVSWNGATEVRGWRLERKVHGNADVDVEFVVLQEQEKEGFETMFALGKEGMGGHVRVAALDERSGIMAYSEIVETPVPFSVLFWLLFFFITCAVALLMWYWISLPKSGRLRLLNFRQLRARKSDNDEESNNESDPLLLQPRDASDVSI